MIYQYNCEKCNVLFEMELKMDDSKLPLSKPCPSCKAKGTVYREFTPIPLTYENMDVHTRAERVAGSDWGEILKRVDKAAGRGSKVQL